ncbi:MAG TPA: hypothetical protein VLB09_09085, partial [Nitrospiria bacterium]|nr:hypothetical protein [Nitrospiria bacterium]
EVEPEHEVKSIGHEDTYDEDIREMGDILKELLCLAHRVSSRLRSKGLRGKTVTLKVKYHDFTAVTRAVTLPSATDDGGEIYRSAAVLLRKTEAGKRPVRLLGISLSGLMEEKGSEPVWRQIPLFGTRPEPRAPDPGHPSERDPARTAKLNEAVDRIREKYGEKGIRPGTLVEDGRKDSRSR